jgi:hypothetical protein
LQRHAGDGDERHEKLKQGHRWITPKSMM